jgi:protein phosphatase 1L
MGALINKIFVQFDNQEAKKMFASFRDLYNLKLKEKPDPRNGEVLETMELVLSSIPAASRTFPIIYQNKYLGDVGAIALCETLRNYKAVNSVSLIRCAITVVSTEAITDLIKIHPTLVAVDFSENTLGTTLLEQLLVALKSNDHIERLGLRSTEATDTVAQKLQEIMNENRTLHSIDLKNNKITQKGFEYLYRMVKQHPHIIKLELQGNEILKEELDKLARVLERNDTVSNVLNEILENIRFKRAFTSRRHLTSYKPRYITSVNAESADNNKNTNLHETSVVNDENIVAENDVIVYVEKKEAESESESDSENEKESDKRNDTSHNDIGDNKVTNDSKNDNTPKQQLPSSSSSSTSSEFAWYEKMNSDFPPRIESSRFHVSVWETIGRRDSMEDTILVHGKFRDRDNEDLFCVFDGHGGKEVSDFCVRAFSPCFLSRLAANENTKEGIKKALQETYSEIDKAVRSWAKYVGSTALTAFIVDNSLFVANVGDTRAVLSHGGKALRLSIDHKPDLPSETRRIRTAGGYVSAGRVKGLLSVSRAIGDSSLPQVIAVPDILQRELTDEDEFLILACDGLWDVVTDQQAVSLIRENNDIESAAKTLVSKAFESGSTDNISVVVVAFKNIFRNAPTSENSNTRSPNNDIQASGSNNGISRNVPPDSQ